MAESKGTTPLTSVTTWTISDLPNTFGEYRLFDASNDQYVGSIAGLEQAKLAAAAPKLAEALRKFVARAEQLNGIDTGPLAEARAALTAAG